MNIFRILTRCYQETRFLRPGAIASIPETGFLRQFMPPHERLQGNPVSFARAIDRPSQKPGFSDNLRLPTRLSEETRFLRPCAIG